jgi:hypothetical protein
MMQRQIDPTHRQSQALRYRLIHEREGDRNSKPPIKYFVQVAVARVIILFSVPTKLLFNEKHPIYLSQDFTHDRAGFESGKCSIGEAIDPVEVDLDVNLGVGIARDFQSGPGEIDAIVPCQKTLKLGAIGKRCSQTLFSSRMINDAECAALSCQGSVLAFK